MLAQFSSKDKQTLFNLRPTVIDKLISKNKSSIQNNLLYTNEESDRSVSEDSEENSSSSAESNLLVKVFRPAVIMAPVKKRDKHNVLDQKSSGPPTVLKRGPGRPPNKIKGNRNLKLIAANKLLENSKKTSPKKSTKDIQPTGKVKKNPVGRPPLKNINRTSASLKKLNHPSSIDPKSTTSGSVKPLIKNKKTKDNKNLQPIEINDKKNHRNAHNTQTDASVLLSRSSPRKFPNNVIDHWKCTGFVIRGRGRGRGRGTRGSFGSSLKRGMVRSERYNTRDSQSGLMRSGKKRKCSDSNLVDGLEKIRKKRRMPVNQIKIECPSDEQSSFVTTSEYSFCETEHSLKQSDEEMLSHQSTHIKLELEDTDDDEETQSRDNNSNVFSSNKKVSANSSYTDSNTIDQSNNLKKVIKSERGCKRLIALGKKADSKSDSSIKDSDWSVDSDSTVDDVANSPKSLSKYHRRKKVDDIWVRRSTRSISKINAKGPGNAAVGKLVTEEFNADVDNSKSSFNVADVNLVNADSTIEEIFKYSEASSVVQTPTKDGTNISIVDEFTQSNDNKISISCLVEPQSQVTTNEKPSEIILDDDPTINFSLSLEETPEKKPSDVIKPDIQKNLVFNISSLEQNVSCSNTIISNSDVNITKFKIELNEDNVPYINLEKRSKLNLSLLNDGENQCIKSFDNHFCSGESRSVLEKDLIDSADQLNSDINKNGAVEVSCPVEQTSIANDDSHQMTDKNTLTVIEEFCQSEHNENLPLYDGSQKSLTSKCANDERVKGIVNLTSNDNLLTIKLKDQHESESCLSEKPNSDCSYQENELKFQTKVESKIEQEDTRDSNLAINKICENTVQEIITLERSNFAGAMELQTYDSLNEEKDCFNSSSKIDDTIESTDKVPESSEESSSDTNSNLSELMSAALEADSINRENNESLSDTNNENRSELSFSKDSMNNTSNESVAGTSSQSSSFSSIRTDPSNSEACGEDLNSQRKLFNKSSNEESVEEMPSKELLSALGLQSLHSTTEKTKRPNESYTGTLKAVIKLNRSSDKKGRKIFFKQGDKLTDESGGGGNRLEYRICNAQEVSTAGVPLTHLADIPANRKPQIKVKSQFDLSNSPNIVGASGSMETPSTSEVTKEPGVKQNLIIPEKSSSFSIHPERLCTDVCSYCFGKFGSLDTPCHLAQLKNSERQSKILAIEVHLSADSCLCDGCFRYVDRKANCPASQRSRKPAVRRGPLDGTICAVQDCTQTARHSVRRKWLIKLKKSIGKKLVLDMDKNPHLPFPLCSQHYYWVDYFTVCGICKKRLTRNHMYAVGSETDELNQTLSDDGIPVRLSDKLFLCKLCRYYSSLRLKYKDPSTMTSTHRLFLNSYRKKILQYHDIPVSESEEEGKCALEENASETAKPKKKKGKTRSLDGYEAKKNFDKEEKSDPGNEDRSNDSQMIDYSYLDTLNVHSEETTTPTVDYSTLGDVDGQVRFSNIASLLNPLEGAQGTVYPSDSQNRSRGEKPTRIQVKFGNLNIGKLSNLNIGQDTRPSSSATSTTERPPYLPGERELNLSGDFEFHGAVSPDSSWERCSSTIQFDRDTKKLWQELQRPYGNQSSFLRHLVILEKHWRSGSLVLSENPNPRAVKYMNSVKNRVQAYDGAFKSDTATEKPNKPEVTLPLPPRPMSTPVKPPSAPPPLMKISPGLAPWLNDQLKRPPPYYTVTSTPTIMTQSRLVPSTAPPPYRYPTAPRTIRVPAPSPTYSLNSQNQPSIRPISISYQQFKRIRLEKPSIPTSQVTVTAPKIVSPSTATSATLLPDFAPLISDVRSLATSKTSDWSESFRQQQQKMLKQNFAKYYTPIRPKIPNSLTVTTFPQTTALVVKSGSLTIEKAPSDSSSKPIIPPEKPSISVFRETTPSESS